MAEKYLKCPNCGAGNTEEAKFCNTCGGTLGPVYAQMPVQAQIAHKAFPKWILVLIVVLLLVGAGIGAIYTQAWSKMKLIVKHSQYDQIGVNFYIDGVLKASIGVPPGTTIVGSWAVEAGTHTVSVDAGRWYYDPGGWFTDPYWYSEGPDGTADVSYAYQVGPLSTTNVFYDLG